MLVTDALTCCLADFGLSLILESQRLGNKSPTLAGSICWMAPELMTAGELGTSDPSGGQVAKGKLDRKAGDIFALGCTIYEVCCVSSDQPVSWKTDRLTPEIVDLHWEAPPL